MKTLLSLIFAMIALAVPAAVKDNSFTTNNQANADLNMTNRPAFRDRVLALAPSGSSGVVSNTFTTNTQAAAEQAMTNAVSFRDRVLALNGNGGSLGTNFDYTLGILNPLSTGASNCVVDFSTNLWIWQGTTSIAFRYATNLPVSGNIGRVTQIYFPATNYVRSVYVFDSATNWAKGGFISPMILPGGVAALLKASVSGAGDSQVFAEFIMASSQIFNTEVTFNPTSIPGLVLWFDAANGLFQDAAGTIPVVTNNAPVQRWNDSSGAGNNITNAGSISTWLQFGAPTLRPCVNFVTNSTAMQFKSVISNTIAQPVYEFMVIARNVTNANHTILDGKSSAGGTSSFTIASVANNATFQITTGTALSTNLINTTSWMLVDVSYNSTQSIIATNGVQVASGNVGTGTSSGFTVGASGNFANRFSGKMAEVLVWSASLSAQNITDIRSYLINKYQIGQ